MAAVESDPACASPSAASVRIVPWSVFAVGAPRSASRATPRSIASGIRGARSPFGAGQTIRTRASAVRRAAPSTIGSDDTIDPNVRRFEQNPAASAATAASGALASSVVAAVLSPASAR